MPEIISPKVGRRIVVSQGVTAGSGAFSVSFSPAFDAVPHVSAEMSPSPNTETFVRVSAVSANGCTVHCFTRSGLTVLGITLLSLATANANGVPVSVLAVEQ